MRSLRTAAALAILGAELVVVGVAVGRPEVGVEGAYFTRASRHAAYPGVFHHTGTGLFSPADGNLWIGAGPACCAAALVSVVVGLRARRAAAAG
jgi:hypothetical protein